MYGLNFTIYEVNQDSGTATDNVQVLLTKQDGAQYTLVPADYTTGASNTYNIGDNEFEGTTTGTSNIIINQIPAWITKLEIVYKNTGTGAISTTQNIAIGDLSFCTPPDSDGDGIFDYLDLDSDNDGIPDNIEAQSTSGYIAPTGSYSITGVDLAFGAGFTPQNTDGTAPAGSDTIPDYLDLDSDGDGIFDIAESGSGLTDTSGGADGRVDLDMSNIVGANGLINSLDNGDTYSDVNGSFDNTIVDNFSDGDSDVTLGGDFDYRDTTDGLDTDKDGIVDNIDIDDDNDGIIDTEELGDNLLVDGGFDDLATSNFGNNIGASISPWVLESGTNTNVVEVDGAGGSNYGNGGPEFDSTGGAGNYFDVASSAGVIYQTFTLSQETTLIYGGALSARDGSSGDGEIRIHSGTGSGGSLVSTTGTTNVSDNTDWTYISNIVTLPAGTYSFVVEIDNAVNFDGGFATEVLDFDMDGIPNHLDIDADNDGIPDNVEAQPTIGYVSPSGTGNSITDVNNNGLDDNYELSLGGTDISTTPRNTDNTDNADYLDTDSDNDGIFDISENDISNAIDTNLDNNTGNSTDGTPDGILDPENFVDTDGDGLADIFEGANVNDDFDVNGEINTPQTDLPDIDSDVTTDDVDYRDDDNDPVSPDYSGNTLWLRADKDVTGGNTVTLWEDQTPTNANFTAAAGLEPDVTVSANNLNFNPTVTFTPANNDVLTYNGNLNPRTMYIVYNDTSTNSWVTPFTNDDGAGIGHGHSDDTQIYNSTWTPADVVNGTEFVNGLEVDFLSQPRPDNFELQSRIFVSNISNETRNYYVGRDRLNTDRVINGSVAEVILYSDAHTDVRRQQVETYLAIKYGFTLDDTDNSGTIVEGDYILSGGNPKVWDYTANSTYHNDVAGIGRDDAVDLDQYQSKSVNSDAIITIGLGAIAATNLTNGNTFTTNKDFLVWGSDAGVVNTTTTTELVCAPEITIGRKWKIVENGSVGSVQIAVNKATIDAALTTPNTLKVLKVADNDSFTTNVEYIPLTDTTINTEDVYAANYDFNGTKYFTYTEINGIFWNGAETNVADRWKGGNSGSVTGGPSTNASDVDKVLVIDAQGTSNHATLAENVEVECVWIKENSKLMVLDDQYLEFDEDFILDGELKLIGNGQLVQTHSGLSNVQGSGKLYRDQAAVVPSIYRYHYWSSPVRELNLDTYRVGEVMFDGNIPTSESSAARPITWSGEGNIYDGAPGTVSPNPDVPIKIAPYWIYSYLNGETQADWVQQFQTGVIERGQGYSMKSTGEAPQNFTFIGTPNDGSLTFNFTANRTSLLGNPYPSALDAINFINTNIDEIDGTLYFWEHTDEDSFNPANSEGHNLTGYQGGYSQRNIAMGIAANGVPESAAKLFDFEEATINGSTVTETVDGITTTIEYSSGNAIQQDFSLLLEPEDLAVINDAGLGTYTMTISFNKKVDLQSIDIFNDVLGIIPLDITISSNQGSVFSTLTNTVSLILSNTVSLPWKDVTEFTISSASPFKIGIDNLRLREGNLPSVGDGTYHAPNRYIAVGQGFFVSASNTGGTVRFENSMRSFEDDNYTTDGSGGGSGTYFFKGGKKSSKNSNNNKIDLLPTLKLGFNYKDGNNFQLHRQLGISFRRGNNFEYDNGYDSEIFDLGATDFYWSFPEDSERNLIIAGVSEITNSLRVPVVFSIDTDNPILIQIDEIRNISKKVYLEDVLTNTSYELSTEDLTEISIPRGVYNNRFFLTFDNENSKVLSNNDNVVNSELGLYLDNKNQDLILKNYNNIAIKSVEVYTILGQRVKSFTQIDTQLQNTFNIKDLSSSVYIVKVISESGILSKKIFIE